MTQNEKNNNIINVSKEGNEKIIFAWKGDKKIELSLSNKNNEDIEKNSFDKVFDFIIECIQNDENIEFKINDDIGNDEDSRISRIANGIIEICKKEINEIKKEIYEK